MTSSKLQQPGATDSKTRAPPAAAPRKTSSVTDLIAAADYFRQAQPDSFWKAPQACGERTGLDAHLGSSPRRVSSPLNLRVIADLLG